MTRIRPSPLITRNRFRRFNSNEMKFSWKAKSAERVPEPGETLPHRTPGRGLLGQRGRFVTHTHGSVLRAFYFRLDKKMLFCLLISPLKSHLSGDLKENNQNTCEVSQVIKWQFASV